MSFEPRWVMGGFNPKHGAWGLLLILSLGACARSVRAPDSSGAVSRTLPSSAASEGAAIKRSRCEGGIVSAASGGPRYLGLRLISVEGSGCDLTDGPDSSPDLSPDGSMVLFNSEESDSTEVIDLGDGRRWTLLPFRVGATSWSPDSRSIVFVPPTYSGSRHDLYVTDVGGSEPRLLASTRFVETEPVWSSPRNLREISERSGKLRRGSGGVRRSCAGWAHLMNDHSREVTVRPGAGRSRGCVQCPVRLR